MPFGVIKKQDSKFRYVKMKIKKPFLFYIIAYLSHAGSSAFLRLRGLETLKTYYNNYKL